MPAPSIRLAVVPSRVPASLSAAESLTAVAATQDAELEAIRAQLQEYQAKMEAQDRQLQELQEFHAKMEAAMQAKDAEIDRFRRIALQTAAAGEF